MVWWRGGGVGGRRGAQRTSTILILSSQVRKRQRSIPLLITRPVTSSRKVPISFLRPLGRSHAISSKVRSFHPSAMLGLACDSISLPTSPEPLSFCASSRAFSRLASGALSGTVRGRSSRPSSKPSSTASAPPSREGVLAPLFSRAVWSPINGSSSNAVVGLTSRGTMTPGPTLTTLVSDAPPSSPPGVVTAMVWSGTPSGGVATAAPGVAGVCETGRFLRAPSLRAAWWRWGEGGGVGDLMVVGGGRWWEEGGGSGIDTLQWHDLLERVLFGKEQ